MIQGDGIGAVPIFVTHDGILHGPIASSATPPERHAARFGRRMRRAQIWRRVTSIFRGSR